MDRLFAAYEKRSPNCSKVQSHAGTDTHKERRDHSPPTPKLCRPTQRQAKPLLRHPRTTDRAWAMQACESSFRAYPLSRPPKPGRPYSSPRHLKDSQRTYPLDPEGRQRAVSGIRKTLRRIGLSLRRLLPELICRTPPRRSRHALLSPFDPVHPATIVLLRQAQQRQRDHPVGHARDVLDDLADDEQCPGISARAFQ